MLYIAFITFTVVASIGPTNIFAIKEGLKRNGVITFSILFGGVLTEVFYANLALYGINKIANPLVITVLQVLGTFFFFYLGVASFKKRIPVDTSQISKKLSSFHFNKNIVNQLLKGVLMTLPNPLPIVLWSSAIANINKDYLQHHVVTLVILSVGFFWSAFEGVLISKFKTFVSNKALNLLEIITAVILLTVSFKFALGLLDPYVFKMI